jgi:hypothetical protein
VFLLFLAPGSAVSLDVRPRLPSPPVTRYPSRIGFRMDREFLCSFDLAVAHCVGALIRPRGDALRG